MADGKKRRKAVYDDRVNRVLNYIEEHLREDLSLTRLARVGAFSRFHFHRIFQGVTGETPNSHVRRVRLERAALAMRTSPGKRITDVALDAGFAGTAEFSRAFKNHFGRTASSWDRRSPLEKSKISQAPQAMPFDTMEELAQWKLSGGVRVRIEGSGGFRFVHRRVWAAYGNPGLVEQYHAMRAWLEARGTKADEVVFIGMSQDDPAITPPENCRYDLGVAFARGAEGLPGKIARSRKGARLAPAPPEAECAAAGLSVRDFASHEFAVLRCAGDLRHVLRAWQYVYRIWLPASAYEAADMPAMEMFVRLPEEVGWETFEMEIAIPVVRR